MTQEELFELTGQTREEPMGNLLPRLRTNYQAEFVEDTASDEDDADPISLPLGKYRIDVKPEGADKYITAFCKKPVFRPYIRGYRYSAYDKENEEVALTTSVFKRWGDTVIDDLGHEFIAKKYKVNMVKINPAYITQDLKLQCATILYGTVTMTDATDMHGNSVEVVNLPCMWYNKGASFMPIAEVLDEAINKDKAYYLDTITLSNKREKKGEVTYFIAGGKWSGGNDPLDADGAALLRSFQETITADNKEIYTKFQGSMAKKSNDDIAKKLSSGSMEDDLNDSVGI
tara:strand:- start:100 stop:960 length:861 start_codon:yes stop_codon:yes gene_type:complete